MKLQIAMCSKSYLSTCIIYTWELWGGGSNRELVILMSVDRAEEPIVVRRDLVAQCVEWVLEILTRRQRVSKLVNL